MEIVQLGNFTSDESFMEYLDNYEEPKDDFEALSVITQFLNYYEYNKSSYYNYGDALEVLLFSNPIKLKRKTLNDFILNMIKKRLLVEKMERIENASDNNKYYGVAECISNIRSIEYYKGLIYRYINLYLIDDIKPIIIDIYKESIKSMKTRLDKMDENKARGLIYENYSYVFSLNRYNHLNNDITKNVFSIYDCYVYMKKLGYLDYLNETQKEEYDYFNIITRSINKYNYDKDKNPSFKDNALSIQHNITHILYLIEGFYITMSRKYSNKQLYPILKPFVIDCLSKHGAKYVGFIKNSVIFTDLKYKMLMNDFMGNLLLDSYCTVICTNKMSMVKTVMNNLIEYYPNLVDRISLNDNIDKRVKKIIIAHDLLDIEGVNK